MTTWHQWCVLAVVVCLCGCSANSEGTEAAARKYFAAEFTKWMAGEKTTVSTMQSRVRLLKKPISYDIHGKITFISIINTYLSRKFCFASN